ncbi:MAG: transporter, family, multidrug resistance protein [Pseudonocardiales bacterium]|jgi:DHA2 family multidrug resistance protein-like MFS transporter|nr:transporter, family, multidrug resistance protein [Pseudonocardiales bacterium]HEV7470821.1 MFS transporter [Pseudonocardia sp.]
MTTTPGTRRAGRREWVGLAVLALACLLYVMDLTVLQLAIPQVSEALRPTSTQLLWIIDVYGFMVAGALVTMGTLGDRIGRRRLLLVGAAAFGLVSILAAFSTTPEMLIASRAFLGIAGATIAPSTLSLIFHMFTDPKQRSAAVGVWIGAFSAGSAVGPVLGGVMLEHFWWGSVFLLALPVMGALLVLGPKVLPEYRDPDAGRLDVRSAAMSVVALLAVVYGVKQIAQDGIGGVPLLAIAVGLLVGVLWVRRQRRLPEPMIDVRLFRIRAFDAALLVNFLSIFVMVGYFLYIAQYLQLVMTMSPLEAGLWSLPSAVAFVVSSQLAPRFLARVRPARTVAGGLAASAAGMLLLSTVEVDRGLSALIAASVVIAFGMGPVFGLTTEMVVGSAPAEKAGAASGVSETAAELGGALGIAVLGSIGVAVYRSGVSAGLPTGVPDEAAQAARDTLGGAVGAAARLPGPAGTELLAEARTAFVDGLQLTSAIAAGIAAVLAVVAAVALRSVQATAPEETEADEPEAVCAA